MAKLLDLPAELLVNVTSHLATIDYIDEYISQFREPTDVATLLSLCLSSRLLRDVAQPVLYMYVGVPVSKNDALRPLRRFLCTLLQRPGLKSSVKELSLTTPSSAAEESAELDLKILRKAHLFTEDLRGGPPIPQFNMLALAVLLQLPNLERVSLTAQWKHPRKLLRSIHKMQAIGSILPKLKTFHLLKLYEERGLVNLEDYVPFLHHPGFEELTTKNNVEKWLRHMPSKNVLSHREVGLYWTTMDRTRMQRLVRACSSLPMFSFVMPRRDHSSGDTGLYPQFTPKDVVIALLKSHGSTLKVLVLDFHPYYKIGHRDLARNAYTVRHKWMLYPSFRDFTNLSGMSIEFEKLKQLRDLPESLKSINLTRCFFSDITSEYFQDLFHLKENWCPNIESVIIQGEERDEEGINGVAELARSLNAQMSDVRDRGRIITFMGIGYALQLQSNKPLFPEDSDEEVSDDDDEEDSSSYEESDSDADT